MALTLYHDTYAHTGTNEHPADLVLLHGWGLHSLVWDAVMPALLEQFQVTVIDLPGFGRSPVPGGDYTLDYLVEHVLAVAPEGHGLPGPLPLDVQVIGTPVLAGGFSVGQALREVAHAHGLERVLYAGAGSGPLMTAEDIRALAAPLRGATPTVVANNLYSADLVGVYPASALDRDDLPAEDNGLPFVLWRRAGLAGGCRPAVELTKTVGLANVPSIYSNTTVITVPMDAVVTYSYLVANSGNLTLTQHAVVDSVVGNVTETAQSLAPGTSFLVSVTLDLSGTVTPGITVTNIATWTASSVLPL